MAGTGLNINVNGRLLFSPLELGISDPAGRVLLNGTALDMMGPPSSLIVIKLYVG